MGLEHGLETQDPCAKCQFLTPTSNRRESGDVQ